MADLVYAFSIPVGANYDKRVKLALKSISQQSTPVSVGLCSVCPAESYGDDLLLYSDIIDYARYGSDDGQSAAINEGWRAIDGDIYAWLNADDYLVPGALQKVTAAFNNNPEADVVFGQSYIVQNTKIIGMHSEVRDKMNDILTGNIISQPSCFIRRKALFDIGLLDEVLHYTMDWDLWVRLFNSGAKFHYLPDVLSMVAWDAHTKTSSLSRHRYIEIFNLRRKHASRIASAQTALSFLLEHISQYGVLSPIFSVLLKGLKQRQKLPNRRWIARGSNQTELHVILSHYEAQSIESVRISFSTAIERQFLIEDLEIARTDNLIVDLHLHIKPGKSSDLYILCEGNAEESLVSIELRKSVD